MLRSNVINYVNIAHKDDFHSEVEKSFLLNRGDFVDTYNADVADMVDIEKEEGDIRLITNVGFPNIVLL